MLHVETVGNIINISLLKVTCLKQAKDVAFLLHIHHLICAWSSISWHRHQTLQIAHLLDVPTHKYCMCIQILCFQYAHHFNYWQKDNLIVCTRTVEHNNFLPTLYIIFMHELKTRKKLKKYSNNTRELSTYKLYKVQLRIYRSYSYTSGSF